MNVAKRNFKRNDLKSTIEEFKRVTEDYSCFMAKYNRRIGSWNQKSLSRLEAMGRDVLEEKTANLKRQLGYYESAEKEKVYPIQESQILWRILRSQNWSFPSDLFPKLLDTDIIEIYNLNFNQYFANSTFMENCSYDLSDIAAYTWPELFTRPQNYTDQVIEKINKVIANPISRTVDFDIKPHTGQEVFSRDRRKILINMGVIAPIFDCTNRPVAFICTIKLKQITN